jgi:hypothetical protein
LIQWVIWYADGSSFSNLDGEPHEAPRWGALCIAAYSGEHGRMIWHGTDYYGWIGEWVSFDAAGLLDYLGNHPGPTKIVLIGRHVPPDVFHKVYSLAERDPRLPPRSSRDAMEDRRPQL